MSNTPGRRSKEKRILSAYFRNSRLLLSPFAILSILMASFCDIIITGGLVASIYRRLAHRFGGLVGQLGFGLGLDWLCCENRYASICRLVFVLMSIIYHISKNDYLASDLDMTVCKLSIWHNLNGLGSDLELVACGSVLVLW